MDVKSYRGLDVWKKGISLVLAVYREMNSLPQEERYGLSSQMRRAAISVPSNIAEGHARGGPAEFRRFVTVAMGSLAELETQVTIGYSLGYMEGEVERRLREECDELGKMLRGLEQALKRRITAAH